MNTPQIITKVYDFLMYLIPQTSKFPRSQLDIGGEGGIMALSRHAV